MLAVTETWPGSVRRAVRSRSYGEHRENNRAEFKPELGRAIRRRRSTVFEPILPCEQPLTADEWDDLDYFSRVTLADGVLPFNWTHPRTGVDGVFVFDDVPKLTAVRGIVYTVQFTARCISGGQIMAALKFNRVRNSQYIGVI